MNNMNLKRIVIGTVLLMVFVTGYGQSFEDKLQVVKLLEGEWSGTLSYLNFQDDKTRGTVDLDIIGTKTDNAVELKYTYFNNGQVVREGKDKVVADNNENKFDFNDSWDIESFEKLDDEGFEIVLITKGKDNGKRAYMKKIITISKSKLSIRRDIKYLKQDGDYFNRHVYSLTKK